MLSPAIPCLSYLDLPAPPLSLSPVVTVKHRYCDILCSVPDAMVLVLASLFTLAYFFLNW